MTFLAVLCFFGALYFLVLALKDNYVSSDLLGIRLLLATLFAWGGVELLP